MEVKFSQAPGETVDLYTARPGTVVYHSGDAYLVVAGPSGLFSERVQFYNLRTGGLLLNPRDLKLRVCAKAVLHINLLED